MPIPKGASTRTATRTCSLRTSTIVCPIPRCNRTISPSMRPQLTASAATVGVIMLINSYRIQSTYLSFPFSSLGLHSADEPRRGAVNSPLVVQFHHRHMHTIPLGIKQIFNKYRKKPGRTRLKVTASHPTTSARWSIASHIAETVSQNQ
jgi:hypothetical protein